MKVKCLVCNGRFALTEKGVFPYHNQRGVHCAGVGQTPDQQRADRLPPTAVSPHIGHIYDDRGVCLVCKIFRGNAYARAVTCDDYLKRERQTGAASELEQAAWQAAFLLELIAGGKTVAPLTLMACARQLRAAHTERSDP